MPAADHQPETQARVNRLLSLGAFGMEPIFSALAHRGSFNGWLPGTAITVLAAIGHFSLTVWLYNRLHALAMPRRRVKHLERLLLVAAATFGIWLLVQPLVDVMTLRGPWRMYAGFCSLVALAAVPLWLVPKLSSRNPTALLSNDTVVIDAAQRLGHLPVRGAKAERLARLPGNEVCRIAVQKKLVQLPRLPQALSGLSIAHLTDLHMTGQLTQEFYEVVVAETNALAPDLILLTGDILEVDACLPWIEATLGTLQARYGKFFVLGNHEQRLREPDVLRQCLACAGFVDLGGRSQTITIQDGDILLAGTELPWFGEEPKILTDPRSDLRILLSHTPDQIPFARRHRFDLMLAGHNHGGQVRLPYLGALLSPSRYGSRYAGGLYNVSPTLLHVSRGLGSDHLIRWNCPPELALLTLISGEAAGTGD
jgi:predicted MPP superfamily phosphohydrolase